VTRPPSLWFAEARQDAALAPPRLPAATDVVVVGGGIMGVSVAFWLSGGGADVVVLESRALGWGASGRNAGLLLAGSSPLEDLDATRAVLEEDCIDAGYEERGHLALATSAAVVERIRDEIARRPETAPPLELLNRARCQELLGLYMSPRFLAGRWLRRAATVDPVRMLRGLAAAAARRGARFGERTAVQRVESGAGDGVEVHTRYGPIRARHAVLACGARTATLAPTLAHRLTPIRGQMLATAPMRPLFPMAMAVDWGTVYWRQTQTGEIVLGGCRDRDPIAERTERQTPNPRIQTALTHFLPESFPQIGRVEVRWRWAGTMDETPDGRPLIGPVPEAPGVWAIAGFGGHGLPPALGAGRALAEGIAHGRMAPALAPYDPGRTTLKEAA
jgi:gamma-glutamylputrescine oxidase